MSRLFFAAVAVLTALTGPAAAADWLHWRGPFQAGYSLERDLPEQWTQNPGADGSNLIWKAPYGCRSTPLVMGGRVFIINSEGSGLTEGERVMAFDAETGKVLWEFKFNVWHTDIVSSRVGWANLAGDPETGYVYAHGVQGMLWCLDGKTGQPVWNRSLTEEFGRVSGYGGRVVSPTLAGNLVIMGMINASWGDQVRGANRFVAFAKQTGAVVWWSSPCEFIKGTYYSNPVVAYINGEQLLITGAADGQLVAMQVNTGKKVWSYPVGANVLNASAVVEESRVYITHGEENLDVAEQGRIVCVDAQDVKNGKPKLLWEEIGIKAGLASPMVVGGKLYVPDDGATLHCFDDKTGKRLWKYKYGRVSRGAPVWADDKIYVADVNAQFHILKPDEKKCKELHTMKFFSKDGTFVETNGTPAVANGRIYFATRDDIYCLGKKGWKPGPTPAKAAFPKGANPVPAQAQIVPGEVTLSPGQSVRLHVRLYDAKGEFIKESPAEWSLPLPPKTPTGAQPPALRGEVKDGMLTVAMEVPGQQGYVDAKVGELTARARVRVAPQLPYKPDFNKVPTGATPGGWVNCQGKYEIVEIDGKKLLKKVATNPAPPVARANAYITPPNAANYTIRADVMGRPANKNMPDHGIVNCRYTLQLNGNKQELRLLSWDALPRVNKSVEYPWKPDAWYTMKLVVEASGDKAVVRGKVWPRDQAEPSAWTIEFEDPRPNRDGAAALYAYATGILDKSAGAESFFDNVSVVPNQ